MQLGGSLLDNKTKFNNMYQNLSKSELDFCRYCYRVGRNIHIDFGYFLNSQYDDTIFFDTNPLKIKKINLNENKFDNMYANMTPEEHAFIDKISQMFNPKKCD